METNHYIVKLMGSWMGFLKMDLTQVGSDLIRIGSG